MLLQFSFKNYRSIKDEVVFSTLATQDEEHSSTLIDFNNSKYVRTAEIYGANGSGKTSVLSALGRMQSIVINSYKSEPGDTIPRKPHKLAVSQPTEFCCIFEKNNIKYSYQFSYNDERILEESLFYWPNGRTTKIFDRTDESFSYGSKFHKYTETTRTNFKKNKLLLSVAANVTDIEEITNAFLFFKKDIVIFSGENKNWTENTVKKLQSDIRLKNEFIKIMREIGSDICDISSKYETHILKEEYIKDLPDIINKLLISERPMKYVEMDIQLIYNDLTLSIGEESSGIQNLFSFICPLLDVLENNKILICDEIERSLHPSIVSYFVDKFQLNNKTKSQIIFTTHDTDLLNLNQIRRDQIWFTQINPNGRQTDLYSLSEIKNVRKDENIKKGYIMGKYGAIPMLNSQIQKICGE